MSDRYHLSASMQDYMEAILELTREKDSVRITDIANRLGFAKPSVHQAVRDLVRIGFLKQEKYGPVELTRQGREQAAEVLNKHRVVFHFLHNVHGVDPEFAERDACRIEHVVSRATYLKMSEAVEKAGKISFS